MSQTAPVRLHTLLGDYPNTRALRSGAIQSPRLTLELADVKVPNRAFKRVVRALDLDVAELALVTFLQAHDQGKPLRLLPAVVGAGRHQHHCLVCLRDRPVTPRDLPGKRVGIRAWQQTTVTWVRGILAEEHGVDLTAVQWVTFEDGHVAECPDPPGVLRESSGRSAYELLLEGQLDAAIIGSDLPDDPRLQAVIDSPHEAATAWARRHALVPINHMVVVHDRLCREQPELVREIYQMLSRSRDMAEGLSEQERALTPYGVEANRAALELLIDYCVQQSLIARRPSIDEIFADFRALCL